MRIGIEASNMLATHLTGIEYSLTELVRRFTRIDAEGSYRLYFNFLRGTYARRFDERVRPLLDARLRACINRIPNAAMNWLHRGGWPIEATLGRNDLVYYHCFNLRPQWRGRKVLTVHDLMPITHPALYTPTDVAHFREHVPRMARAVDAVVTVSEHTRQQVIDRLGLPADRVFVAHPGVDERFAPQPPHVVAEVLHRLGIGPRPYLLFVGTAEPRKNLPGLLRAYATLRPAERADLQVVVAGKSAWGSAPLREQIAALGLQADVRLLGYVAEADIPPLYSGARLAALPSLAEGFGSPLIEAMACGTPMLAANATALPEVYGDAALGVDPQDVDALADGLRRLLYDESLRAGLVARGLQRARRFSWDRTAQATVDVFRRVAG